MTTRTEAKKIIEEKFGVEVETKKEILKIKLSDLKASLVNKNVEVDCQITGEQTQKAIPKEIEVCCETCGKKKIFNSLDNPESFISDRQIKTILQEFKNKFMCGCAFKEDQTPNKTINVKSYVDYSVIYVRDLLDRENLTSIKRYESKRVYVINQILPNSKTINIKGRVFIEPQTKNISIICDEIKQLENQIDDFKITDEFKENSKKYFNSGIKVFEQINPDIIGEIRDYAKQSIVLQLHSPSRIYDIERKKQIRGGLNIIHFGDTKCAKSELIKDVTNKGNISVGEYTIAETGSRTGFLYTIDNDRNALIWGSLVLNDLGLIVLDGLQAMHPEELGQFREAIEGQEVIVRRSISGEALARTRILSAFNPNKSMDEYIYKCQAILDTYIFKNNPDITRWDLFIPYTLNDVGGKEISFRESKDRPIPINIFINHIYWAWSRTPDQVIYTDTSIKKIKEFSQELIEDYSLQILPIVHNGVRDIITRFSVAMACQMHSTDETHEKVIVESEHVEKVIRWYKKILGLLELEKFKDDIEGKSELTDNEIIRINQELGEIEYKILELIKHDGASSSKLGEELELAPKTIKEHYKPLQKHKLIETRTGIGIKLTIKGVKFVKWGMTEEIKGGMSGGGEIGTKKVSIKNDGNEKGVYLTAFEKDRHIAPVNKKENEFEEPVEVIKYE